MRSVVILLFAALAFAGCARSTIQTRKQEKVAAYAALPPEEQQMVDQGRIRIGMSMDAVYIAWGPPAEVLESESAEGHVTSWIYHGAWMEETRYWTYREVPRKGGRYLERYLDSDYNIRDYVRAEIQFENGVVTQWRTLPKPVY